MKEDGISVSVNAPVALSYQACLKVNRMMAEYNKRQKEVICLGTMHPLMGRRRFERSAVSGKNGIKA